MSSARSVVSSLRAGFAPPAVASRRWLITAAPTHCAASGSNRSISTGGIVYSKQGESSRTAGPRGDDENPSPSDSLKDPTEQDGQTFERGSSATQSARPTVQSLFGDFDDPSPSEQAADSGPTRESAPPPPPPPPPPSKESALSSLFDGPDAFPKVNSPGRSDKSAKAGLSAMWRQQASESDTSGAPGFVGRRGLGRKGEPSRLSPQERDQWMDILRGVGDVFADRHVGRFASRNDLNNKFQSRKKSLGGSNANRLAALQEGLSTQISAEALEIGVDEAKQEMNSKVHEADLWEWAIRNVWGFDQVALRQAAQDLAEGKTTRPTSTWALTPQYGASTPYYAPVLHRLSVHFRDRLKSPNSALAVLRITRALSPQSFVLGCTPELYSEALSTMYYWMHDLRGCLVLLQEARDLGVLGDSLGLGRGGGIGQSGGFHTTSLPGIVQTIHNDVSKRTLAARAELQAQGSPSRSITDHWAATGKNSRSGLFGGNGDGDGNDRARPQVNLESLSLPALDALRIVEEMNSIVNTAIRASQPESLAARERPSRADDMHGFGFDSPSPNMMRRDGRGGGGMPSRSGGQPVRKGHQQTPSPRTPRLTSRTALRPQGRGRGGGSGRSSGDAAENESHFGAW